MFLVTGGTGGADVTPMYADFDSTEILDMMVGSWTASRAKLPQPMWGLRAVNFNNRVLIFGNDIILSPNSSIQADSISIPR